MKKKCELCMSPARMYCESDDANLCWDCDHKIHSANFLVAKHSRSLLCHTCQSSTPWQAAGPKLSPNISICLSCAGFVEKPEAADAENQEEENQSDEGFRDDENNDDDEEDEEEDDGEFSVSEGEEEDGENQVVPLSSSPSLSSPIVSFSGGDDESSSRLSDRDAGYISSLKRSREEPEFDSSQDDEISGCFSRSSRMRVSATEESEANSNQEVTERRKNRSPDDDEAESSRTAAVMESLKRFRKTMFDGGVSSETCKFICDQQ